MVGGSSDWWQERLCHWSPHFSGTTKKDRKSALTLLFVWPAFRHVPHFGHTTREKPMPFTLPLGSPAPDFTLAGVDGRVYRPSDWSSQLLVLFFTCNHCPYVVGSENLTRKIAARYADKGVQFVAISSNSPHTYPEDRFAVMVQRAEENPFPWPYLYDADQSVARAYGALRTPHFYLFDRDHRLRYCGHQFAAPRHASEQDADRLVEALEDLLAGHEVRTPLTNPIGCNVKWEGQDAHWMPPEACDLVPRS